MTQITKTTVTFKFRRDEGGAGSGYSEFRGGGSKMDKKGWIRIMGLGGGDGCRYNISSGRSPLYFYRCNSPKLIFIVNKTCLHIHSWKHFPKPFDDRCMIIQTPIDSMSKIS